MRKSRCEATGTAVWAFWSGGGIALQRDSLSACWEKCVGLLSLAIPFSDRFGGGGAIDERVAGIRLAS